MADVSTWSPTAASNNQTPPDGWPENMLPSQVNDTGREMMAAIRRFYDDVTDQVVAGNVFATGGGQSGGYWLDGFLTLTADNADGLYLGHVAHWNALALGKAGGHVLINNTAAFSMGIVTVANLPAATLSRAGQHFTVVNALAPAWNTIVVGGGTIMVDVICDGANWKVI